MGSQGIQQTLHGYAGGHRLLASSIQLSPTARETMAALSDLSGTRPQEGFETYLTGYPLEGTDFFIFARTWIAPEMPRPGCVWTHSLLIPNSGLGLWNDLSGLARLHSRPVASKGYSDFESTLQLPSLSPVQGLPNPRNVLVLRQLLSVLYSNASPVVLATTNARNFEREVLGLWSQQWPSLRRSFLFCTGSLASRSVHGRSFDLQVMPYSAARTIVHDSSRAVSLIDGQPDSPTSINDPTAVGNQLEGASSTSTWVDAAIVDAMNSGGLPGFRTWLSLAAESIGASRENGDFCFSVAAALASDSPAIDTGVSTIAARCDSPAACLTLKEAVVGPDTRLRERDVLKYLATAELPSSFADVTLQLRERASRLWSTHPAAANELVDAIVESPPTDHGREMLVGLAERMPVQRLVPVSMKSRGVLYSVALGRPSLLLEPDVWRTAASAAEAVAALAAIPDAARPDPSSLLLAIVETPPEILDQIGRVYGAELLKAALHRAERSSDELADLLDRPPWQRLARDHRAIMRTWLAGHPPSLRVGRRLAEVISPAEFSGVTIGHWQTILPKRPQSDDLALLGSLFALAMSMDTREAGALAGRTFGALHKAAEESVLPDAVWNVVIEPLPGVPKWMEWDRCERLRRGLVDAFVNKGPWQFADFVAAFENDDRTLEAVCAYARGWERGRKLLRRLAEAIEEGRVHVSQTQRRLIEESGRKRLSDYLSF